MRVNLIKEQTVRNFAQKHATSVPSFEKWIDEVRNSEWDQPKDMKNTFNSVDFLGKGSHRAIFNVSGNNYRVICKYRFGNKSVRLYVVWLGTHAEYTTLCKSEEQYTADNHKKYI